MLASKQHWILKQANDETVRNLAKATGLSELTARLLVLRGVDDPKRADLFLHPEKTGYHDPFKMLGMRKAVERINKAISEHESIRVFGDYDADGVTATALLYRALKAVDVKVSYYIPNRFKDGYGPNRRAVEKAGKDGISLIITVDSGIAAYEAGSKAGELGIDYIITDHHEPPSPLPKAYTIVNPKQPDCRYPFKGLSGAGIAMKLVQAFCPENLLNTDWLALAAIGTIADLVPLRDENRLIASKGLELISAGSLAGIDALKESAGHAGSVDSDTVGFQLAPRLNAAGRLTDAAPALQLLLTDDRQEARLLADDLEKLNQQRKTLVDQVAAAADQQAAPYIKRGDRALVLAGENWHQGVIGIAASKLVEKYYRPVIILSVDRTAGKAKGSGRSITGFNLYRGLAESAAHLEQFGGHKMAAGLSLSAAEIDLFRADFVSAAASQLDDASMVHECVIDARCTPDRITTEIIDEMARLAPFGTDNPRPLFQMDHVAMEKINVVGRDRAHLRIVFKGEKANLDGIGFRFGPLAVQISPADRIGAVGEFQINEWNGFRKPQFMIEDLRVEGLQIFDWRSGQEIARKLSELPGGSYSLLAFQPDDASQIETGADTLLFHPGIRIRTPSLILLDLPESKDQLSGLFRGNPEINRVYAVFAHRRDHFFNAFPPRQHFVWYYSLIRRQHTFRINQMANEIARFKGWSERTVIFMTKVFFELGFVKIDKGVLTANSAPDKASLAESDTYRKEKNLLELEDFFCYSPISKLKAWFVEIMMGGKQSDRPEGNIDGVRELH
jgi:single-stranded-DNA-specific exonuclease RecJ